jgi:hypothetical protein
MLRPPMRTLTVNRPEEQTQSLLTHGIFFLFLYMCGDFAPLPIRFCVVAEILYIKAFSS